MTLSDVNLDITTGRDEEKEDPTYPLLQDGGDVYLAQGWTLPRIRKEVYRRGRNVLRLPILLGALALVAASFILVVVIWPTAYHLPPQATYRNPLSLYRLATQDEQIPRITIVQHFDYSSSRIRHLQDLSREQHTRYADFWGYGYRAIEHGAVPRGNKNGRQGSMNKLYAVLEVALGELGKGQEEGGAEWILMTDADNLVVDPTIPVHALLPPHTPVNASNPLPNANTPIIIGTEDINGFNAGNVLFKCSLDLIYFISHTLALTDEITKSYHLANTRLGHVVQEGEDQEVETPPSDQRAMCLVVEQDEYYAGRFWHYKNTWLNEYTYTYLLPSMPNTGEEKEDEGVRLQLHIHLAASLKYQWRFDKYVEAEWRKWNELVAMDTKQLEQRVEEVKQVAEGWWTTAKIGKPKCIWI